MSAIMRCLRRIPFPARVALPLALLAVASVGLRPASQAADLDPWVAGERATVSSPAGDALAARIAAQAADLEGALGLAPAADRHVAVIDDRFHERRWHEVTYRDARGRPIGIVRLDPGGDLLAAVLLGYRESHGTGHLDAEQATAQAALLVRSLGVAPPDGAPSARPMMNGALWAVTWARRVEGVPVDGDGVTVRLWRSGDLHSVTVSERPLDRPVSVMSPAPAREYLARILPELLTGERRADAAIGPPALHWVAGNDRFRPAAADAPASTLRLAYAFELRFGGPSAELLRAVTIWIDAETGALLGGDVLR